MSIKDNETVGIKDEVKKLLSDMPDEDKMQVGRIVFFTRLIVSFLEDCMPISHNMIDSYNLAVKELHGYSDETIAFAAKMFDDSKALIEEAIAKGMSHLLDTEEDD